MGRYVWACLLLALASAETLRADDGATDAVVGPPPVKLPPRPAAPATEKKYQALKLFAQARLLEKQRRPAEALALFEKALALDPAAPAIAKALIPLCFQLDRETRALDYCKRAVELDPDDFDLAYKYGQTLREKGLKAEALPHLARAANHPQAKGRPALQAEMLFSLATVQEELKLDAAAAESYAAAVAILDKPEGILADPAAVSKAQLLEETARTYERLGHALLRAGNHQKAVEAFTQAQQRCPQKSARLQLQLAAVRHAAGQPQQALVHLEQYLATQPPDLDGYEKLIELLTIMGRATEIVPRLEQASQRDPFNQRLKLLLAQQCVAAQDPERAEALYLATLANAPSEEAYRGLAGLYAQLGRWEELLRRFDDACATPERAMVAKLQLDVIAKERALVEGLGQMACLQLDRKLKLSPQTRRLLAALSRQAKLYGPAERLCRSLLADGGDVGAVCLELCRVLAESDQHAKEADFCLEALAKKTMVAPLIFRLERARALAAAGQHQPALALAEQLVKETTPGGDEHLQARFMRATVNYRAGLYEAAATEAEACLTGCEDAGVKRQLRHLLSTVYSFQKNYASAQKHLEALLEEDEDDAVVCNDLGYLWAEQGQNLEEAERLIRKAIELERSARLQRRSPLDPPGQPVDSAAALDSLAWVLHQRGRHAEAAKLLEHAVRLPDGDDPGLHLHLGDIYAALSDLPRATAAWRRAAAGFAQPKWLGHAERRREAESRLRPPTVVPAGAMAPKP